MRIGDSNGPKRFVVLGGCGFIGSHVCKALVDEELAVRIFDKLYVNRKLVENIEAQVEFVEADMTRTEDVLAALKDADTVINLIHTTVPGSSMNDPAYDVESNVVSTVRWLSRLNETSVRRLIFVSSGGTVYGLPRAALINEEHATNPINSYGITKLAIEKYVAMYATIHNLEYVILRPSNVYGAGQRLNIGQGVIGVLVDRALKGQSLEIWGSGDELRDYLYIDDFVAAVMKVVEYRGPCRIFNVGAGMGRSVNDIVAVLKNQLGKREIVHRPARGFDVPENVLDASLLSNETGWKPHVPLEEGIARVIGWLKEEYGAGIAT